MIRPDVIDRAVPPTGPSSFFQVGFVVRDLAAAVAFYTQRLGAQPFVIIEDAQLSDQELRGTPFAPRQSLAFGYMGHLQVELIQPLEGGDASLYTEFLDERPQGGLHHTAVHVADIEHGLRDIGAGAADVLQSGRFGEATRIAYVDVAAPTGALLELIQLDEGGLDMFEATRAGGAGGN